VNAIAVTDEVVPEVFTPKVVNRGAATRTYPFGITAKPGSKTYFRLYARAYRELKLKRQKEALVDTKRAAREAVQPHIGQHITLGELARSQGWPSDRKAIAQLRNRLLARQRTIGTAFLVKMSVGGVPGGKFYTTLPMMRRYVPELFDEPAEGVDLVKTLMASVDKRLAEMQATIDRLRRRLKVLEAAGRTAA